MSSKSEHEPTSGRSRGYGSGHPIQVCPDIGRTFSWLPTSPINVMTFLPSAHWSPAERAGVQTDGRNVVSSKPKNGFNSVSSDSERKLQETWGSSEIGCCWCARSCDSRVIERTSPERTKGQRPVRHHHEPNPAGRHARGKAPRSPCIALRPRFGGASFLRPIQIRRDGYRSRAQRLSRDGACSI